MANPMYVYISVSDLEWRPGSRMIPDEYSHHVGRFAHYMADKMKELLVDAIDKRRYDYRWDDLSVSYLRYKKKHNLSLKKWEATGLLKDSIDAYRSNNKWVVGINPYLSYKDSGVKVLKVARWLEYGTDRIPPRPLFRPIARYMRKHVRRYWNDYKDENNLD
jgi:hypothetical protein